MFVNLDDPIFFVKTFSRKFLKIFPRPAAAQRFVSALKQPRAPCAAMSSAVCGAHVAARKSARRARKIIRKNTSEIVIAPRATIRCDRRTRYARATKNFRHTTRIAAVQDNAPGAGKNFRNFSLFELKSRTPLCGSRLFRANRIGRLAELIALSRTAQSIPDSALANSKTTPCQLPRRYRGVR